MVGLHDVGPQRFLNDVLVTVELIFQVMAELALQGLKFRLGVLVVPFELHHLFQALHVFPAFRVILEAALKHALPELLIVGVGDFERPCRSYRRVAADVIHLVFVHHLRGVHAAGTQVIDDVRQRVGLHDDVGRDAPAVAHRTAVERAELMRQRVGDVLRISAVVAVVDGLYAPPAGNVVFAGGQLHLRIVWQVQRQLHQALAVGARAHHHGAVEVLQGAAGNLARRCRVAVNEHHHGHHRVDGLHRGLVGMVGALHLAAVLNHGDAFFHEHVHQAGRLRLAAPAIAAKVEHKGLHALVLHLDERAAHLACATISKLREQQVSDAVAAQTVVGDGGRLLYLPARYLHLHHLPRGGPADFQHERGAGVAAKVAAHVRGALAHHRRVVHAQDDVALLQSRLLGRRVGVGLVNHRVANLQVIAYERPYARIFPREERLQLVGVGIIDGVGVQRLHHAVDAVGNHALRVQRIDIKHVEVAIHGVENLKVLAHLEVVVGIFLSRQGAATGQREQ